MTVCLYEDFCNIDKDRNAGTGGPILRRFGDASTLQHRDSSSNLWVLLDFWL